jgi:hypothetical protein
LKRLLLALAAVAALGLIGRAIYRALASEETKIGWLVDDMTEGFDDRRTNAILTGLDTQFLDETYGADRDLVRAALVRLFFEANDETTKKFLYRVEWSAKSIVVTDDHATAELDLNFLKRKGESFEAAWKARVKAQLQKKDGYWRFVRTETSTAEGQRIR